MKVDLSKMLNSGYNDYSHLEVYDKAYDLYKIH